MFLGAWVRVVQDACRNTVDREYNSATPDMGCEE